MLRFATVLCTGALALAAGACGDDGPSADAPPTETVLGPTRTVANPMTERIAALKDCLGGKEVTRVDVFEPTYQYALTQGGGGFAVKLRGQQVQFIVFPDAPSAQQGYQDAQNQLIAVQQRDPAAYAAVSATAMQLIGTVLEIVPTGAVPPRVGEKIAACAAGPVPQT